MKGLATGLGLSRTTVSLVLNGRTRGTYISDATRQRILEAAEVMGYQPNQIARAVATGRTKVIGVLGHVLEHEFTALMVSGVVRVAQRNGYLVKIQLSDRDASPEPAVRAAVQQRLAGIVSIHSDEAFLLKARAELARHSIPLAIVDHTTLNLGKKRAPGIRVVSDDEQGVRDAVAHLAALGHRRIALLSVDGNGTGWRVREKGYRNAMRRFKLRVRDGYLRRLHLDHSHCREAASALLRMTERPTALVCVTDMIAMVALRTARMLGLRVPEDLSVIGFADLDMAQFADPPLTSVAQPFEKMGEVVAERLLAAIAQGTSGAAQRKPLLLSTRLVVRESTGPANAPIGCGRESRRMANAKPGRAAQSREK
ncbi:MAG: LacI family DNA-binding transcriptional regulator [Kiritimatiellae bacterium]|nr:LacI family DNA-binding transcriptional regulator [Kiritimatiellia bacterium]